MSLTTTVANEDVFGGHLVISDDDGHIVAQVFLRMAGKMSIRPTNLRVRNINSIYRGDKEELLINPDFTMDQLEDVIQRLSAVHDAIIIHLANTAESNVKEV